MRVLIPEVKTCGHCLSYAVDVAGVFASGGDETHLVVSASAQGTPHAEALDDLPSRVTLHWAPEQMVGYRTVEQGELEWALVRRLIAELEPDRTFIPTGDPMVWAVESAGAWKHDGLGDGRIDIVLHAVRAGLWPKGFTSIGRYRSAAKAMRLLGRRCRFYSCDPYPTIGPGVRPLRLSGVRPPLFTPYPIPAPSTLSRDQARGHFDWPSDRTAVVALGDIAPRKAGHELIRAVAAADWPADAILILAGQIDDGCRATIDGLAASARERIVIGGHFLPAEAYQHAYRAADIVWAGTPSHVGLSGTQVNAAIAERPSILLDSHVCGAWLNGRIGPGVVTQQTPGAIAQAVSAATALSSATDRQRRFCAEISSRPKIASQILGRPAAPEIEVLPQTGVEASRAE